MMEDENDLDLIVIGWGKGGKTLAGTLARAGQRVAIVEASKEMYGGTCINIGCVPTKILIHDAENHTGHGFDPEYFDTAVERRDKLTAMMRAKNFSMLDTLDSVMTITGRASFIGPRRIRVQAGDETLELGAKRIIINTGAIPASSDLEGASVGGRIHDSTTLQHAPLPKSLVVIGGGPVGLEFASMFGHFGSNVTVLDRGPRALKNEDVDVAAEVLDALNDAGVRVEVRASVQRISQNAHSARVHYEQDGRPQDIEADAVLIALGRTPATLELKLAAAGIETTASGAITVDDHLSTTAEGVYALGDVNGGPQFTYVSLDDNRIVTDAILGTGKRSTADRVAVPHTTFTTPPLARVGLSEQDARAQGLSIKVAVKKVSEIAAMPRPKIVGDARGIIKFVVDAQTDLILGAALVHVDSQEVINLVALAMRQGVTSTTLRDSIFTHPSSTEALNEVLGSFAR